MSTHSVVAQAVRLHKAAKPDAYCSEPRCLYRTTAEWCPKHQPPDPPVDVDSLAAYTAQGARSASGRRPNQRVLRERLSRPYPVIFPHAEPRQHEDPKVCVDGLWLTLTPAGYAS